MDSREVKTRIHEPTPARRTFSWMPLVVVCFCMGSSYFMVTSMFPYAGYMVMSLTGVSADKAGFEAGWLGGALALGRVLATFFWGWAVDYFGRKPVLVWSMVITATSMIAFGTAETLAWAVTIRFLQGGLTGTVCVSRVLTAELAGQEHVVAAMAMLTGVANLGGVSLGPAIGGLCAEPARHYPSLFSSTGLFGRYPFLLPNLIGAAVASLLIPLVVFVVPEKKNTIGGRPCRRGRYTRASEGELGQKSQESAANSSTAVKYEALLDRLEDRTRLGDPKHLPKDGRAYTRGDGSGRNLEPLATSYGVEGGRDGIQAANTAVSLEQWCPVAPLAMENVTAGGGTDDNGIFGRSGLVSVPNVRLVFIMGFLFSAVLFGLEELFPLWAISSHGAGGLGWDTPQIGVVVALGGASVAMYQVFVYPSLADKMGIVTAQHASGILASFLFVAIPNITYLSHDGGILMMVSTIMIAHLMCFLITIEVGLSLVTTNPVPPRLRGKMNGLYLTCYYAGSISPWLWAIAFAWSISSGRNVPLVDHRFVFNLLGAITMIVTLLGLTVFTVETMTLVAEDVPSSPVRARGPDVGTPRSVRISSHRRFLSPDVSGGRGVALSEG